MISDLDSDSVDFKKNQITKIIWSWNHEFCYLSLSFFVWHNLSVLAVVAVVITYTQREFETIFTIQFSYDSFHISHFSFQLQLHIHSFQMNTFEFHFRFQFKVVYILFSLSKSVSQPTLLSMDSCHRSLSIAISI